MRNTADLRPPMRIEAMFIIPVDGWKPLLDAYLDRADTLIAYFPGDGEMAYGKELVAGLPGAEISDWPGMVGVKSEKIQVPVSRALRDLMPELVRAPEYNESLWDFDLLARGEVIFSIGDTTTCIALPLDGLLDTSKLTKAYNP